jgi:predicted nucleotidyltransferase
MISQKDVLRTIRRKRAIFQRYGIKRLGLFGSFAQDRQKSSSDLDFLVEFEKKTFDAYMGLKIFLEELFHRHVDLVLTDSIKPQLRQSILEKVIYV